MRGTNGRFSASTKPMPKEVGQNLNPPGEVGGGGQVGV